MVGGGKDKMLGLTLWTQRLWLAAWRLFCASSGSSSGKKRKHLDTGKHVKWSWYKRLGSAVG